MNYIRSVRATKVGGRGGRAGDPIRFTASTPGVKRDGKDLDPSRWMLDNYRKNPVVLYHHDYWGSKLPIGKADVTIERDRLVADIHFDQGDEFAREIERKYRDGYMNAVSVGWDDLRRRPDGGFERLPYGYEPRPDEPIYHDLLDISAVVMPGDPDAVMERTLVRRLARERTSLQSELAAVRSQYQAIRRDVLQVNGLICLLQIELVREALTGRRRR